MQLCLPYHVPLKIEITVSRKLKYGVFPSVLEGIDVKLPSLVSIYISHKKEAQLMLINLRDVFRGQSRSLNMVPFDMLRMVSC